MLLGPAVSNDINQLHVATFGDSQPNKTGDWVKVRECVQCVCVCVRERERERERERRKK